MLEKMENSARVATRVLDHITEYIVPGAIVSDLDMLCLKKIEALGAVPAPPLLGFPAATCISLNHVVAHGIPNKRKLKNGDIVNIDISIRKDNYFGDTARMYKVGKCSIKANKICDLTKIALEEAIKVALPGNTIGQIGNKIEQFSLKNNLGVVKEYGGHGIGKKLHQLPHVHNYGKPEEGPILIPGMFITIEPMLTIGSGEIKVLSDDWTIVTRDKSLSAQWEHTIAILENGNKVLTRSEVFNT